MKITIEIMPVTAFAVAIIAILMLSDVGISSEKFNLELRPFSLHASKAKVIISKHINHPVVLPCKLEILP
jgi:hypothetical protein